MHRGYWKNRSGILTYVKGKVHTAQKVCCSFAADVLKFADRMEPVASWSQRQMETLAEKLVVAHSGSCVELLADVWLLSQKYINSIFLAFGCYFSSCKLSMLSLVELECWHMF